MSTIEWLRLAVVAIISATLGGLVVAFVVAASLKGDRDSGIDRDTRRR